MKGLLYKDFIAVKGKIFLFLTIAQLLLLSLLKITVTDMEIEMIIVNIFVCIMVILFGQVIFFLETSLIKADSKKQTDYILSLPVEKKEYVASKYIYILGAFVYITVICAVEILILKAGQESGDVVLLLEKTWDILPVIAGGFAIVCAVELPFYFILGMEKGAAVKLI
ncbi:MAG: ABC-2 transporter permease, partial [Butyrivibrio sp.]